MASDSVQEDMIKVLKIADLCTTKLVLKVLVDADSCAYRSPDNSFDKNDKLFSSNFPFLAAVYLQVFFNCGQIWRKYICSAR